MSYYNDNPALLNEIEELKELVVSADSLCSLILYRESSGLSEQTKRDLDKLVGDLRRVTDRRSS